MSKIIIIIFRESLEIALLLGTIFAATKNLPNSRSQIACGVLIGFFGSLILAAFANKYSAAFGGFGEEIFNIIILVLAISMMWWTIIWMKKNGPNIKRDITNLSSRIAYNNDIKWTLPLIVAIFIFREGIEILLFVYSIYVAEKMHTIRLIMALSIGGGSGLLVGIILYKGLTKFNAKRLFKVTAGLLVLIAASLAAEIANLLNSLGIFVGMSNTLWDTSWLVSDSSIAGHTLATLVGYQARPTALQVIFYFTTIILILASGKFYNQDNGKN